MTPFLAAVVAIFRKDIQTELRGRELVATMGLFALISILIFSFALELDRQARVEAVSGVLYVTVVFASILGLNRGIASEREGGGMDALLLAPIPRTAMLCGKLLGGLLFVLVVSVALLPVMSALYNVNLFQPWALVALALGALGFTTIGTVLATLTAQTRAREALLPLVMLPVALPVLLCAVRATTGVLRAAPEADWMIWVQLLVVVNVIYFALALVLYEYVVEE
ncbi:MAG: heme exporter protein CcmB [Chloroflexota bacterium]|nr:heme exporter protein CcmB [Chloroflexota bacterium]